MDPDAEALLRRLAHPLEAVIAGMRQLVLDADSAVRESVKWNAPSYATTEHFATFQLRRRDAILLVLHRGARARPGVDMRKTVPDPDGLLSWKGPDRAIVTLRDLAQLRRDTPALTRILAVWVKHV
jgi:hypothetical protein